MSKLVRDEPAVVHDIRVEHGATDVRLSCRLRTLDDTLPPELWFRFPPELGTFVEADADPFLPPLLLFCMKSGVRLVIDAEVSPMLLSAVARIQEIYCKWAATGGERLVPVEVTAGTVARPRRGESSGAFFSCGVDSFFTLLRNVRRYPPSDSRCISRLLLVHGFDVPLQNAELFGRVQRHARSAADHFGKQLVTVATNVRAATRDVDWGFYGHGAALASVGLALGRKLHTVFIPSTSSFVELRPWGSHPALDPLWSTEQVEFVHDGGEATRDEKIRLVASSPVGLQSLRVCWENRDGAYNCGRCEKCLRTMIELRLCGALERARQFPSTIAAADVEQLTIPANCRKYWRRMLEQREELADHELVDAIEAVLRRHPVRGSSTGPPAIARRLSQIGLTRARIEAVDRRLFGGGVVQLRRWLHRRADIDSLI